jgi:hypothetical protein
MSEQKMSMTLKEATEHFIGGALQGKDAWNKDLAPEAKKAALVMIRAFQCGAVWACRRFNHEMLQDNPKPYQVMLEILEEHAAVEGLIPPSALGNQH